MNILIVEGENDKRFLKSYIKYLNQNSIEYLEQICNIEDKDIEYLEGITRKDLVNKLRTLKRRVNRENIKTIGIILDSDMREYHSNDYITQYHCGIENKLKLINSSLKSVFKLEQEFKSINDTIEEQNLKFICHILNVNGNGELEDLLKLITKKENIYTKCLKQLEECLVFDSKIYPLKKFNKEFIFTYGKSIMIEENREFTKDELYSNFDYWNFEHPTLNNLKTFLYQFN